MSKLNSTVTLLLGLVALLILISACGGKTPEDTPVPTGAPATSTPVAEGDPEKTVEPDGTMAAEDEGAEPETTVEVEATETLTPDPTGLTAAIVSGDIAGAGKPFTFDATQSEAGELAIEAYEWDMGDGTYLFGLAVQHAYAEPGEYTVTLTIVDEDGQRESVSKVVVIVPLEELLTPTAVGEDPMMALIGTSWLMDKPVRGTIITLNFDEDYLSGSSGCNSYSATYAIMNIDGVTTGISVGAISGTSQTCTQEIMSQERFYLEVLASASSYRIVGDKLVLETGSGDLPFTPAGQ